MANESLPTIPLEISRGASETFLFSMTDPDGNLYYLQAGEVLRFGVKMSASYPDFLIKRMLTAEDLKDGVYKLVPLLDAVGRLLPDKVREILAKYTNQEE